MCCGPRQNEPMSLQAKAAPEPPPLLFRQAHQLIVFGHALDRCGSRQTALNYRLARGEANYWANVKTLNGAGSVTMKMQAFHNGPATCGLYGCGSWHVTQQLLLHVKRWEFKWLRRMLGIRRAPEEGRQAYHSRSSRRIVAWGRQTSHKFMRQRLFTEVFRSAWRERHVPAPDGHNYLSDLREARDRHWWDGVKDQSVWLRGHFDFKHWSKGAFAEWEDVLVHAHGLKWRSFRSTFTSLQSWMSQATCFVNFVCDKFGLPRMADIGAGEPVPLPKRPRRHCTLDDLPMPSMSAASHDWHTTSKCFICVVDCLPVQGVACGHGPLLAPDLKSTFDRIAENFAAMLDASWTPPRPWMDPVMWKRRGLNTVADYLANFTMDSARSWSKSFTWPFPGMSISDCNLAAWSDGGSRRYRCAASAWIVEVGAYEHGAWKFHPLAMGGAYFNTPISSFHAECLALEECSLFLRNIIERYQNIEPLGKRQRCSSKT